MNRELAVRFDVRVDFWVDPDNQVATVLAADGTVLDVDETENYRIRTEPGFLARALEQHGP